MAGFQLVPVLPWDFSVIDQEFNSIRDHFLVNMRSMEDEMSRFHREFSNFQMSLPGLESSGPQLGPWLEGMNSPLVQEDGDNKQLKLRFDVSQYKPEEITVKTDNNMLKVHAKHEEKTDCRSVHYEYNREFLLPKGTDPDTIKSSLSKDGVLTVEAPLPAITSGEKVIPIKQN